MATLKKIVIPILIIMLVVCVSLTRFLTSAVAEEPIADGNALFTQYKCVKCHKIEMEVPVLSDSLETEGGTAEGDANSGPPNLWDYGSLVQDTEWLSRYLMKEIAHGGKKHMMKFQGSAEELNILTLWLVSLKGSVPDSLSAGSTVQP